LSPAARFVAAITATFTVAGDVSSFNQNAFKNALATQMGVPTSVITLYIYAASVSIQATITYPSPAAASAAAMSLAATPTATLSAALGVTVQAVSNIAPTSVAITMPSPSPPPQRPPGAQNSADGGAISILAIAVPAAIVGLLCCLAMVCWWTRRRQVKVPRKDANHWLRNVSVSTVTADDHHPQEPPACTVAVAATSTPIGEGSSGGVGIEMSGRFDGSSGAKARMTRAQELLKAFELDAREIRILEKLGEGGQGVVVRGWWHGMEVAIKQPRPLKGSRGKPISPDAFGPTSPHDSFKQAIRREVRALSRVRHPNVIKLHGACFEPAPMVLMSYAPSGTLQDALDNHQFQTPLAMVRLLAGIARGMEAVHAHKIIHLDLKPENVLIGPLDVPWITDFGLSTSANMTSMSQSTVGGRGTLPFKAPELFVHPPHVGPEADVYAFSILAWIVVCGEQPYAKMLAAATSLPQAVVQGVRPTLANPNEEWQDKTIGPMVRLIEGCWHAEYTQRPTFGGDSASLDGSHEEGGEGSKGAGSGGVARLEKMEYSLSKGYEMEASQLALATRLISTESEAETLGVALVQIGAAQGDARTTEAEKSELAEEKAALETSQGLLRQHAFALLSQMPGGTGGELASALSVMLQQQSDMFRQAMLDLSESVERSLSRLAEGELDCPRLFVLLPMEKSSSKLMQLVKREFLKDKYRLIFLDPVTGCAVRCGPEGDGYKLEMPKKWLVENRKIISAGLRIVKMTAAASCVAGLPLGSVMGLPSQAVSKAEVEAVKMFERVYSGSVLIGEDALGDDASSTLSSASPSSAKAVKAATGRAYKQLRKMLKEQCEDEYLVHCEMTKEKARDGSIEFVSAGSKERFLHFGQQALIWNDETLKQKAAAKAAALKEVEVMAAAPTSKAKAASLVSTGFL
jgi:serine/threonine protein kinase